MKKQTLFLKATLILLALPILAICLVGFPFLVMHTTEWALAWTLYGIGALLYSTATAYFMALYQALKLLNLIDDNSAFSYDSVTALKKIKWSGLVIAGLYAISMPLLYIIAEHDDAPGVIIIGLVLGGAALVVSIFATVLQQLLTNAIAMKNENDLTI